MTLQRFMLSSYKDINNLKEKGFSKNLALTQANLQYTV